MRLVTAIILIIGTIILWAQSDPNEMSGDTVSISIKAKYPGGEKEFQRCLSQNFYYPEEALENDVAGTVFLSFVIDTFGSIIMIQADSVQFSTVAVASMSKKKHERRRLYIEKLTREGKDYGMIKAAKKSLEGCSNWIPAEQDGVKVKMRYKIPIRFDIF